ncbi:hypothetical protein Bbelb_394410 [Branchiostoma belcheri]|nr:hypothetical protein Bbelb_394410 [Branchiostoma belcheri]
MSTPGKKSPMTQCTLSTRTFEANRAAAIKKKEERRKQCSIPVHSFTCSICCRSCAFKIGCPDISEKLNKLDSIHCRMQDNCLGLSCCLSISVPPFNLFSVRASVSLDPCTMILTMELGPMKETKNLSPHGFAEEDDYSFDKSWTLLDSVKLQRSFRIKRRSSFVELFDLMSDMKDLGIELGMADGYLTGTFPMGPWDKTFFNVKVQFMVGPIPMYLGFGAGGSLGVKLEAGVSLMKMTAYGQVTPQVGAIVSASLGVWLLLLSAELRLDGHVLTTDFPTRAEIGFSKFPMTIGARMDMVMIPLRLELRGLLVSEIPFLPPVTLLNILMWHYETPPITANIFNTGLPERDLSPPTFRNFKLDAATSVGRRAAITTRCEVQQLAGRDVVEPAFQLEVAAEDDESQVKLTYDVGTYRGGHDIKMKGGVPLYFTVTGTNSGGGTAKITCELPTYDVTLPGGRVTPDFLSTSHPSILRASALAHDDSVILLKREGVGYGRKVYGDQVVQWHDVSTTVNTAVSAAGSALQSFTGGRTGRVISTPVASLRVDIPQHCAMECMKHPPAKCLSFNYDYGHGTCELLEEIEGHGVKMHEVGHFHNFERLGVGHAVEFKHEDLQLTHDVLYYFNLYLNNALGYVNILTSRGVLADFTPPSPGPLQNVIMDVLMPEACEDFVLDHWEQFRCGEQTPLPNHRYLINALPGTVLDSQAVSCSVPGQVRNGTGS